MVPSATAFRSNERAEAVRPASSHCVVGRYCRVTPGKRGELRSPAPSGILGSANT